MRAGIRARHRRRPHASSWCAVPGTCRRWRAPRCPARPSATRRLIRGLTKVKAAVTWVPWTHRRLASATGYGAGVTSPGWYHHLYTHPGPTSSPGGSARRPRCCAPPTIRRRRPMSSRRRAWRPRWRALRGRPLAGLAEVDDSARAVLASGQRRPDAADQQRADHRHADRLVPATTPMVPLARSLAAEQRRCRLKPEVSAERSSSIFAVRSTSVDPSCSTAPRCWAFRGAPRPKGAAARARSARRGSCVGPRVRGAHHRGVGTRHHAPVGVRRGGQRNVRSAPARSAS